jgi:hypothetical protein
VAAAVIVLAAVPVVVLALAGATNGTSSPDAVLSNTGPLYASFEDLAVIGACTAGTGVAAGAGAGSTATTPPLPFARAVSANAA